MDPGQFQPGGDVAPRNHVIYSGNINIARMSGQNLRPICKICVNLTEHDHAVINSYVTGQPQVLLCATYIAITPEITREVNKAVWLDRIGYAFKTAAEKHQIKTEDKYTRHRRVLKLPDPKEIMFGSRRFSWAHRWPLHVELMTTIDQNSFVLEDQLRGRRSYSMEDMNLHVDHRSSPNIHALYAVNSAQEAERALQPIIDSFPSIERANYLGHPFFKLLVMASSDPNVAFPTESNWDTSLSSAA